MIKDFKIILITLFALMVASAVLYVLTGMQWAGYLALFIAWILFVAGVASASKEATRR